MRSSWRGYEECCAHSLTSKREFRLPHFREPFRPTASHICSALGLRLDEHEDTSRAVGDCANVLHGDSAGPCRECLLRSGQDASEGTRQGMGPVLAKQLDAKHAEISQSVVDCRVHQVGQGQTFDVTLKPQMLLTKGIRSVPVVEVGNHRLIGNST